MSSSVVLAFDIYGTLFDTSSIQKEVLKHVSGDEKLAADITKDWRTLQLEYSWRLNAMRQYMSFVDVTQKSLINATKLHDVQLDNKAIEELIEAYLHLDCFPDAAAGVEKLSTMDNVDAVVFTNGSEISVKKLLQRSALHKFASFLPSESPVTVEAVRLFKPAKEVYHHLIETKGKSANPQTCYLVSSNPFDVSGARAAGMSAIWVDRSGKGWMDQLGEPSHIVSGIDKIPALLASLQLQ